MNIINLEGGGFSPQSPSPGSAPDNSLIAIIMSDHFFLSGHTEVFDVLAPPKARAECACAISPWKLVEITAISSLLIASSFGWSTI